MKRILIVYAVILALTLIIPAAVCFTGQGNESGNELVTIFRQSINLIGYYH